MSDLKVGQELLVDQSHGWNGSMSVITITRVLKKYIECSNGKKYNLNLRERGVENTRWINTASIYIFDDYAKKKLTAFNYKTLKNKITHEVGDCVSDCIKHLGDEFIIELRDFLHSHNSEWFTEGEMNFKLEKGA